ncbi:MAG: hypothetical protein D6726_05830 [Nitrospirae bacterium]|nr:MAG: hypothetical protein D6726_05830 [Nitrospirota bacterium]
MFDTLEIYEALKEDFPENVAKKLAVLMGKVYTELANTVTKTEFNELKEVVRELAEAQKRTEARVEELAEAQKKTEQRVDELAEAQKRTEEEIKKLATGLKQTRDMVAGLSDTVGYGLEDRIIPYMERFAHKEYGIKVEVLDRRNIIYPDGRFDEVNIYIEGKRNGKRAYLIGECKARPSKRDIKRFNEVLKRVREQLGENVEGFIVGYYYAPDIERYIRERYPEIKMMKSFQFELKYGRKAS